MIQRSHDPAKYVTWFGQISHMVKIKKSHMIPGILPIVTTDGHISYAPLLSHFVAEKVTGF